MVKKPLIAKFCKYTVIGVLNTAVHWLVFYVFLATGSSQALANVSGFAVAVTVSFILNAKYNFATQMTPYKYFIYVAFLAGLAVTLGWLADKFELPALLTLIVFSSTSLVIGFLYANFIVFRSKQ